MARLLLAMCGTNLIVGFLWHDFIVFFGTNLIVVFIAFCGTNLLCSVDFISVLADNGLERIATNLDRHGRRAKIVRLAHLMGLPIKWACTLNGLACPFNGLAHSMTQFLPTARVARPLMASTHLIGFPWLPISS